MANPGSAGNPIVYLRLFYVRFLLRQGVRRGQLLAVLIPSGIYALTGVYPLVDGLMRSEFFDVELSSGDIDRLVALMWINVVGAVVNALVMWLLIRRRQTPLIVWFMSAFVLIAPLVFLQLFSLIFLGGGFSLGREIVIVSMMSAGYVYHNTMSSLWPLYRQFAAPTPGAPIGDHGLGAP